MTNVNRDYLVMADLKNAKITHREMYFYNTDKNIANLFVKLQIVMSTNEDIKGFVSKEQAENYVVKMTIIKPKTNLIREITGEIQDIKIQGNGAVYLFDLPKEFTDQVGSYVCELEITCTVDGREEVLTCDPFMYTVKASVVTGLNGEIEANPDLPILKQLIKEVRELQANGGGTTTIIDDLISDDKNKALSANQGMVLKRLVDDKSPLVHEHTEYQTKIDDNLNTIDKTITGSINELMTKYHSHDNKTYLDKITKEKLTEWDNKAEDNHNHDEVYAKKSTIPVVDVDKLYVDTGLAKKSDIHEHPYLSNTTKIPTKTSELTNDSSYVDETFVVNKIEEASLGGDVDLSGYATIGFVNTELVKKSNTSHIHAQYLTEHQDISNKIDKVIGKGLSTNDYTTTEKSKLEGLKNADIDKSYVDAELGKKINLEGHMLTDNNYTTLEKSKLSGIEGNANNYIHPSTHDASVIIGLSTVATSGSYNDLNNKPSIPKDSIVTIDIVEGVLTLTEDKYQTTVIVDATEIVLPTVTSFSEVHLFFSTSSDMTLILPTCRWQSQPTVSSNKVYELIFTKVREDWLGGCVIYE